MTTHFEVVRTDAEQPWHARVIGSNGEPVWSTEKYADPRDAMRAIQLLGEVTYQAFELKNIGNVDERKSAEPRLILCPECASGKRVNCTTVALDPELDDFVPCATTQEKP